MKRVIKSFKDLLVWQKSIELIKTTYSIVNNFPKHELYCLSAQIRRSAISIASNIAEGRNRSTRKDFRQFLFIALGSGAELETQIIIARELDYIEEEEFNSFMFSLTEVMKMINGLISKLNIPSA